ncbi:MAG TPA: hypothetical protein VG711_00885 [Phycisphaerales bacterium]|nr:hypothetical protein [Phycisphaerales bacterium]
MRWMWIDRIIDFEEGRRLSAIKNVSLAEEHLHDHFPADEHSDAQPVMPASLMIEGMAQTAGILVGTLNRFREKVILAKIVSAKIDTDVTPGQTIRYDAELESNHAAGAATNGIVSRWVFNSDSTPGEWERIGEINLLFSHIDQNFSGLDFPKENFVFSDNFKMILRAAGLDRLAD